MPQDSFRCVFEALRRADAIVARGLTARVGASRTPYPVFPSWEACLRPGLVLLSAHLYNGVNERSIALAAVLQFIHLAARIHATVEEDEPEAPEGRRVRCQLPVLLGDYLYTRFFTTLCEGGLEEYLPPLARLVCSIGEAGMLRRRNAAPEREICLKETGELMGLACRLGGELAGAPETHLGRLYRFGLHFGLAYGLNGRAGAGEIRALLSRAGTELCDLPAGEARTALEGLLVRFAPPGERVGGPGG